ncbi:hypothetical protein AVEN_83053-1 [Araneus ventricosus]|uniref:HTH psq-type domain-containing protein n=1 Tax=Araneus ventricosus TaxID=182803 RepID=A0A4Y2AN71_ARAVE|nr:hypothetical protein AVEN_83053-1 [Araneus ventricosus]
MRNKTYVSTTPQETFLEVAAVVRTGCSLRKAAGKYGINFRTLHRYCTEVKIDSHDCDKTSHSSEPGIELAFIEFEGKRNNHYTGRGHTRWDRWLIKSFPMSIFAGMVPETVCAEMLSWTCLTNLVGEVVHKKLSCGKPCSNGFRNGLRGIAFADLSFKPCR